MRCKLFTTLETAGQFPTEILNLYFRIIHDPPLPSLLQLLGTDRRAQTGLIDGPQRQLLLIARLH